MRRASEMYHNFFDKAGDVVIDRRVINRGLWVSGLATVYSLYMTYRAMQVSGELQLTSLFAFATFGIFFWAKIDASSSQQHRAQSLVPAAE